MHRSTLERIDAIVQRHLEWYERYPYTKPRLERSAEKRRYTNMRKERFHKDSLDVKERIGRPLWDPDRFAVKWPYRHSF